MILKTAEEVYEFYKDEKKFYWLESMESEKFESGRCLGMGTCIMPTDKESALEMIQEKFDREYFKCFLITEEDIERHEQKKKLKNK